MDSAVRHWKLLLLLWACRRCWTALSGAVRHWRVTVPAAGAGWLWFTGGWPLLLTAVAACAALTAGTSLALPSVRPLLRGRLRAAWRGWWVYGRRWARVLHANGLTWGGHAERVPRLRRLRCTPDVDRLRVRMLEDQTVAEWEERAPALRGAFSALDVRASAVPDRPAEVELRVLTRDPLRTPRGLPPLPAAVNLSAVPVGVREDGDPLTLPLWRPGRGATHWLVAGETGAGKGSVLWSLLGGVAPLIADGTVRVWGIDPKGGMELGVAAPLFSRLVWGEPREGGSWQEPMVETLEDAVRGMQLRAARLRRRAQEEPDAPDLRVLTPTPDDPLTVVVVDELAALVAYITDAPLRKRASDALSLLLSQGRAPGVAVIGASQDVRKETVGMRDLFPGRIGLRTAEAGQADLILGRGAHERGAATERIPRSSPGVAYVAVEDEPEPVRARFGYADDAALRGLSATFPAPPMQVRR